MKRIVVVALALLLCGQVFAQDIHFTQYFSSPLTLNPAMTGNFNGVFRVAANYRNQWLKVSSNPYTTYSGSFDVALLRKQLETDQLGIGAVFIADKAGDGNLSNQVIMLSLAYHKGLDAYNKHHISLGFQGGIVQKRLDIENLIFESQFDNDIGFNPLIPSGEVFTDDKIIYADFNGGIMWSSVFSDKVSAYAGLGYFHFTEPKESFLGNEDNRLNSRINVHGGVTFKVGEVVDITPAFLYMNQAQAQQVNIGAAAGIHLNEDNTLYFGLWNRFSPANSIYQDALNILIGFEFKDVRLGLSYDANISDLRTASDGVGAFEVSLVYIYGAEEPRKMSNVKFCPKF